MTTESPTSSLPQPAGPYRLLRLLGQGGFGRVYLGEADDGRRAAVKLLHPVLASDPDTRRRFAQEVEQAGRVNSFCIAPILDFDIDSGRPWLATEYIEGPTLHAEVTRRGPHAGDRLRRLAVSTATALSAIHAAGVVHRDLKPDNIMLAADGPRVIDFGIARALDSDSVNVSEQIGTFGYMAPEQLEGFRLTSAVDIFAWASVMVFAATGRPAFPAPTKASMISRVLTGEPDLDEVPPWLTPVLRSCLVKEPERRPKASALLERLVSPDSEGPSTAGSRNRPNGTPAVPPTLPLTRHAPSPTRFPEDGLPEPEEDVDRTEVLGRPAPSPKPSEPRGPQKRPEPPKRPERPRARRDSSTPERERSRPDEGPAGRVPAGRSSADRGAADRKPPLLAPEARPADGESVPEVVGALERGNPTTPFVVGRMLGVPRSARIVGILTSGFAFLINLSSGGSFALMMAVACGFLFTAVAAGISGVRNRAGNPWARRWAATYPFRYAFAPASIGTAGYVTFGYLAQLSAAPSGGPFDILFIGTVVWVMAWPVIGATAMVVGKKNA